MTFQKSPPGTQMTCVLLGKGNGRGELTFKIDSYLGSIQRYPPRMFTKHLPSSCLNSTFNHLHGKKIQTGFISSISRVK